MILCLNIRLIHTVINSTNADDLCVNPGLEIRDLLNAVRNLKSLHLRDDARSLQVLPKVDDLLLSIWQFPGIRIADVVKV